MSSVYRRNFDDPDETIELERLTSRVVSLGGMTVSLDSHHPGWRWEEHVSPLVGTEWCETHHVGFIISGGGGIRLPDGTEFEVRKGDVIDIPPGHVGWTNGDEPMVMLAWQGVTTWLGPVTVLKERILVTMLFTDIVDSTGTAHRIGDQRWLDLLAGHNQRMSELIDRYRGGFIKFTGDGMLAFFDGAVRAVKCALACQRAASELGLSIRTGVHTGEVEMTNDDAHGFAIHEAQRIMTHADPDTVLVSATTAALARDTHLVFEALGQIQLRGVDEAMSLYRVMAATGPA